jgi:hypothetical protein
MILERVVGMSELYFCFFVCSTFERLLQSVHKAWGGRLRGPVGI